MLDTLIEHAHTVGDGAARLLNDGVQQPDKCLVVATVDGGTAEFGKNRTLS